MRSIECEYAKTQIKKPITPASTDSDRGTAADLSVQQEWPLSRRTLELELMHQWTSITYKSYCGTVVEEYHSWQVLVPRLALKHDFLLYGLFAMSALEIADQTEDGSAQDYVNAALHYQSLSSSSLRTELSSTDLATVAQDKHQALYAAASILMVLALALPRFLMEPGEKYSMLEHMLNYLELLKGLIVVVYSKISDHREDPLLKNYRTWDELDVRPLESTTREALDRLVQLNEEIHGASRTKHDLSELQAMSYHAACRRAAFWLQECYERCSEPDTRGYMLAWLLMAGHDFIAAIKDKEPVALLMLMHWGVLLETQSYGIWWAQRVGRSLVEELSEVAAGSKNEKFADGVSWARAQVGLQDPP